MNWQPIKTAPRDGTPVLLWLDDRLIEARWNEIAETWKARWAEIDDYGLTVDGATAWMPVPDPPSQ